ncbi:MAG: DNA polymerase III subunit epsilon [Caulobacteraceae bacterium]
MAREVVLDTETTGLDPDHGHRIIEIACVEIDDYLPTGRRFHCYVDPEREVDWDARRVHGISSEFLQGKPRFGDPVVVDTFLDFVAGAAIVAHNAAFDRGFINSELKRAGRPPLADERWVDTLSLAQKRFPGTYNSLDALCRRFRFSLSERDKHGALIDAQLLAKVYLELRGGRERSLDLGEAAARGVVQVIAQTAYGPRPRVLPGVLKESERAAHAAFVRDELGSTALWLKFGN